MDQEELEAAPRITDILVRTFQSRGGRVPRIQTIEYLQASTSLEALAFLNVYREMNVTDRACVPLEAICIAAKVSPLAILGAVLMAAKNLKAQESALKAIIAHPDVIDATIDAATQGTPILIGGQPVLDKRGRPILSGHGDVKAQTILHQAIGFLPTKQGSSIAINLLGGGKSKDGDDEDSDADAAFDEAFGSPGEIAGQLEQWGTNRRALTDGK